MASITMEKAPAELKKAMNRHRASVGALNRCIEEMSKNGEKRIALFIEEIKADGKTHTRRL